MKHLDLHGHAQYWLQLLLHCQGNYLHPSNEGLLLI